MINCIIMKNPEFVEKAESLITSRKYEEAFGLLDFAIKKYPDDEEYPEIYARALFSMGIFDLAQNYAGRAIELGSGKAEIYRIKAACLLNQGKFENAMAEIKNGLQIAASDNTEHSNLLIMKAILMAYEQESDWYSNASPIVAEARKLSPSNRDILLVGAYVHALGRNQDMVREFSNRLMEDGSGDPNVLYFLINANIKADELERAREISEILLEMNDGKSVSDYSALLLDYEIRKLRGEQEKFFPVLTEFLIGGAKNERKINLFYSILRRDIYRIRVLYSPYFIPLNMELLNESDRDIPQEINSYVFNDKFLDTCIRLSENDQLLHMFRAVELLFDGDPEAAMKSIGKSIEIDENWLNSLTKSIILMNSEDATYETAEEADSILRSWEDKNPENPSIHLLRAIILSFALGKDGTKEIDSARSKGPYEYSSVLTDILIRISTHDFGRATEIIDDFNQNGGIDSIGVFHQISMLKAYCMRNVKDGTQFISNVTRSLKGTEEFGVWVEMLMNELKFIPDYLFVENLPVPLVYPFNDPDPHELLKSVKDAIIAEGFA